MGAWGGGQGRRLVLGACMFWARRVAGGEAFSSRPEDAMARRPAVRRSGVSVWALQRAEGSGAAAWL